MNDLISVPDLEHHEQDALDALVVQWRAKRNRNNLRSAFYDMKNSERELFSDQAPDVVRRRRFVLGWAALAVDKLYRRCTLDGFYDARGEDLDALGLDDIAEANRLTSEIAQAAHASLMHGPAFVVTTQGDTGAGEPDVLVHARSAEVSTGMWNVRLRALSSFLSITDTNEGGEPTAFVLYLPNLNVMAEKSGGRWSVTRRAHRYGVPVDALRYRPRLGRSFGASRINNTVMSLHMQALATMIRADVNGEAYSLPRYVLLGATEDAFRNADGSAKPMWQSAWDAIWAIGDDENAAPGQERADIKQFSGQTPEPQNAHLRMLAQMFSGETGIPLGELGMPGDANPTSAEALLVSRDDLIAEARQAMGDWSPDIARVAHRALEMRERRSLDLRIRPRWANPVHSSPAALADAGTKILASQPWLGETDVGLELLGLSEDQRRRALADRRRTGGSTALRDRLREVAAEVDGRTLTDGAAD